MLTALLVAVWCVLVPFVGLGQTGLAQPAPNGSREIAEGRALFNRSCTMCHGVDGEAGDRGPALRGGRRFLRQSERDLFDAIRKGIPGTMMPPTDLGDEEVHKIVAYIRSLRATAFDAALPGDVRAGERIFWVKARCGDCHMLRSRGGIMGPDLSDIGGTRTAVALRDALTKPLPIVPRGYRPARLTTMDGQTLTGLVRNENNFSIQFLADDGRLHLLLRQELRDMLYEGQSRMPRNYDKVLNATELQDLIAFLSRQARNPGARR